MCVPLAVAAAAVSAVGSVTSGVQGMMAGNYQAAVARQNAAMDEQAARDSIARGQTEARDFYRHVGAIKGQQVASLAANGVDLGFGSADEVQKDTAQLSTEDASNLYKNIDQRTKGFDIQGANEQARGASAKMQGRSAFTNSLFQGASSLMGGFQQNSMMRARLGLTGG